MERAKRVVLLNGTQIDASPERPLSSFLKVMSANVTARFSLTEAFEIYSILSEYFTEAGFSSTGEPEVREANGELVS